MTFASLNLSGSTKLTWAEERTVVQDKRNHEALSLIWILYSYKKWRFAILTLRWWHWIRRLRERIRVDVINPAGALDTRPDRCCVRFNSVKRGMEVEFYCIAFYGRRLWRSFCRYSWQCLVDLSFIGILMSIIGLRRLSPKPVWLSFFSVAQKKNVGNETALVPNWTVNLVVYSIQKKERKKENGIDPDFMIF